jgi:hypothetical protein
MYATRAASRAAPAVFRAGIRTSIRPHRPLNRSSPAVSILIPLRFLQTESTSSSSQNYPPPGFDAKQASKPLSKQDQQQQISKKDALPLEKDTIIPKSGPTAHPKTVAQDARTLKELAKEKADVDTTAEKKALSKKEEEKKKLTLGQKIKKELLHYWDGTKLLVAEVRISSKLALKMAAGYELTRRERRQVRQVFIYQATNANSDNSCNAQFKILLAWSRSCPLSSFHSPNCCSQSRSSCSPTCFQAHSRASRPRTRRPQHSGPPEKMSATSSVRL